MKKYLDTLIILCCLIFIASHGDQATVNNTRINNLYHAYGGFQDSSVAISITQNQWSQITNADGDLFSGDEAFGMTLSGDTLYIERPGDYHGIVSIDGSAINQNELDIRLYSVTDAVQVGYHKGITGNGVNNKSNAVFPVYIEVEEANEAFVLQITNRNANNSFTVTHGQFEISYLHN